MSNQSLVDDDDQTIDNPEVSTHEEEEEFEGDESEEINDDDLDFDVEIARISRKTSEFEEERVDDLKADKTLDVKIARLSSPRSELNPTVVK